MDVTRLVKNGKLSHHRHDNGNVTVDSDDFLARNKKGYSCPW